MSPAHRIAPEPRFARVAAAMADPSRARMLATLLAGEHRSAGELARAAGITAQAASTQLRVLQEEGLVSMRSQGRHKYFALADGDIAHALEALSLVAERDAVSQRWQRPQWRPLQHARRCYGHLAGELGVAQYEYMLAHTCLQNTESGLALTAKGEAWLSDLGLQWLAASQASKTQRVAYPCMDWSQRKDHLAGPLAKALLEHYLTQHWLQPAEHPRALRLTPLGQAKLQNVFASTM